MKIRSYMLEEIVIANYKIKKKCKTKEMFCEKELKALILISTTLICDRAELAMQGPQEETLKMLPQKL